MGTNASVKKSPAKHTEQSDSLVLRIASGVVLGTITLTSTILGGAWFAALVAFIVVIMSFEWSRMVLAEDHGPGFYSLASAGSAAIICAAAGHYHLSYSLCFVGGALAFIVSPATINRRLWVAFGAAYLLAPTVALLWLRQDAENGRGLTLMLFLLVWAADSCAYFMGRIFGGPKLSPALSPAKTWSGAIGGAAAGGVAGLFSGLIIFGDESWLAYAGMGASLGLASILGDMCESGFKRQFGVKDMSNFIPGHGGVLDRLDGMIFATAALTVVLYGQIVLAILNRNN